MSKVTDKITELDAALDAANARITEDVDRFRARIAELEDKVATGTVTEAELVELERVKARVDAIDPDNPATNADVPPTPPEGGTSPA